MNSIIMKKRLYLFAIPALVFYLLFWIFPIFRIFQYSITDYSGYAKSFNYVGMRNFIELFGNSEMFNAILNTLVYTLLFVAIGNIAALCLAFVLNMNIRAKGIYRSVAYLPTLFSTIVVGFIWGYVYMPDYGLISSIFKQMGINGVELNLIGNYSTALYAVVVVEIWKSIGANIVIFIAGLQTVPHDMVEAGMIDGCTGWQLARYIKIPLIAPSITINVTLGIISGLKGFDYIFIITQGGPGRATDTLIYSMFRMAFADQNFGKASALGVVSFGVIIIITGILVNVLRRKEVTL